MPQLTVRAALTGFLLGGILSATALYIAGKTGITIGVGVTSVVLAFAIFRTLAQVGFAQDLTILENNCTQSIATAAGYMVAPLTSGLAAYMLVTGAIVPWWQMMVWNSIISVIGVLVAFPLKRRFINDEQLPFPEGRAAGVVLDALYSGQAAVGVVRAKLLFVSASIAAAYQLLMSDGWMRFLQIGVLRMHRWAGLEQPWHLAERLDDYYYALAAKYELWTPRILGTDIRQLGLRFTIDAAMLGIGGLMGVRIATSVLLGAVVNFAVLAPIMIRRGDIAPYTAPDGTLVAISRGEIVNQWSLWWAIAMMVVGSLVGLLARPEVVTGALRGIFRRRRSAESAVDPLRTIELPLWVSVVGVPILSIVGAHFTHVFFGVSWFLSLVSLPLIFVLTIISTNSMALTSWTPTSALAKITQFSMGAIDRTNPASNLVPATMTAEISTNASNLLSDIKPGYMLGAKPRQQAIGHVIGILAGAIASVPLFYLLFLPRAADGTRSTSDHRLGPVHDARGAAVEGGRRPHHQRVQPPADVGGGRDGGGGAAGHRLRGAAHPERRAVPAVGRVDRARRGAAARRLHRHVAGGDALLVHGTPRNGAGHARTRDLGRGPRVGSFGADLGRGTGRDRERDPQRVRELTAAGQHLDGATGAPPFTGEWLYRPRSAAPYSAYSARGRRRW